MKLIEQLETKPTKKQPNEIQVNFTGNKHIDILNTIYKKGNKLDFKYSFSITHRISKTEWVLGTVIEALDEMVCVVYKTSKGEERKAWVKIGSEKLAAEGTYTSDQSGIAYFRMHLYALELVYNQNKD